MLIRFSVLIILLSSLGFSSQENEKSAAPVESTASTSTNPMREKMLTWSRQLGVTCIHCHNIDNFKEAEKSTFKTALLHDQAVRILQQDVFNERDKGNRLKVQVSCFMCHRGKETPDYREPPNQLTK